MRVRVVVGVGEGVADGLAVGVPVGVALGVGGRDLSRCRFQCFPPKKMNNTAFRKLVHRNALLVPRGRGSATTAATPATTSW